MKQVLSLFVLIALALSSCQSEPSGGLLDAKAFSEKAKATKDAVILDVRTSDEFSSGYIDKAVNIDYYNPSFQSEVSKLDKSRTYFVYCEAGGRSASAAEWMRKEGFTKVFDLDGGISSWKDNKLPLVR